MKKYLLYFSFLLISFSGYGQETVIKSFTVNPEFDKKISSTIHFTVPTMSVTTLKEEMDKVYILDAREKQEYNVSHIPNAKYIGHTKMATDNLKDIPKDAKVVVYCSIGYRSEEIGEKMRQEGFTNVHNLYGSIFEWVNNDFPIVDKNGKQTKQLHTYDKDWSQWVEEGKAEKVW
ncbi:MAG: rhodanese-like domain-containing protein [Saprospiraceae bacterium]